MEKNNLLMCQPLNSPITPSQPSVFPPPLSAHASHSFESNSQDDTDEEIGLSSSDDESTRTCASPTPSSSSFNVEVRSGTSTPTCSVSSKEFDPPNPPATKKRRVNPGPTERAADRLNREKMAVLNSIAESIAKPLSLPDMEEERMDEDDVFGQYVASRLRKIKDQRTKTRLIAVLNNAISEAELSILDAMMPNFTNQSPQQPAHYQAGGYVHFLNS
uniref:BESS domain-containing protein n=1 Tax=Knipowitschia caucasica TaxID=637954 RepID=A0AAV2LV98_KNICA